MPSIDATMTSGERYLLLRPLPEGREPGRADLRETANEVEAQTLFVAGWIEVTGDPIYEQLCTKLLHADVPAIIGGEKK